jgi:hypothetical protein
VPVDDAHGVVVVTDDASARRSIGANRGAVRPTGSD